jgi:hypothetical protein
MADEKLVGREDEITDRLFIDQALIPADICSRSDIEQLNRALSLTKAIAQMSAPVRPAEE